MKQKRICYNRERIGRKMKKLKRISALIGVIILIGLYLLTLIAAIFNTPQKHGLFMACIFATFAVPAIIYAIQLIYRVLKKK